MYNNFPNYVCNDKYMERTLDFICPGPNKCNAWPVLAQGKTYHFITTTTLTSRLCAPRDLVLSHLRYLAL